MKGRIYGFGKMQKTIVAVLEAVERSASGICNRNRKQFEYGFMNFEKSVMAKFSERMRMKF